MDIEYFQYGGYDDTPQLRCPEAVDLSMHWLVFTTLAAHDDAFVGPAPDGEPLDQDT